MKAFGVGALEEEDDDIYATETLSKYDTVLKDEEPGDGLYGWTAPRQYKSQKGNSMGPRLTVGPSVRTSGRRDCTIDIGGSASGEQEVVGQRCRVRNTVGRRQAHCGK